MKVESQQLADEQHPWIGLASFKEGDREFFAGRGEEIDELLRLVRRDTLTLLYGVSGLGKTSLLQAGLFPAVRAEDFLPVAIRLDYMEGAPPLAAQVLRAIRKAAGAAGVEAPEARADETLWEFFHRERNQFWSARNEIITPFLVFDQFEEAFTLGRETSDRSSRVSEFIGELANLVENRPPTVLREDPQRAREFIFKPAPLRVLLAMREDYLADLDRIRSQFRELGQNRLRLLPMGDRQARQVIGLGDRLLAPGVAERIVTFAAGGDALDAREEIAVAPALLSLVLRELNERRLERGADAKITPDLLDVEQQQILQDFYLRTLQDMPMGVRVFIEDKLLTATGYRNSCALDDALRSPDVTQPILNELVNRRLLAFEDRHRARRVEITHDVLAPVIKTSRDTRLTREALAEAEKKKLEAREKEGVARRRLLVVGVALVFAVVIGASFGIWQARLAKDETARAEELQEELTAKAAQGELTAAGELKLEEEWAVRLLHLDSALSYLSAPSDPKQNTQEFAAWAKLRSDQLARTSASLWAELRYGAASRAPLIRSVFPRGVTKNEIQRTAWSPVAPLLATAGRVDILLWSFSGSEGSDLSGKPFAKISHPERDVSSLRFSADGKLLLVTMGTRWEVVLVTEKKVIFTSPSGESLMAGDAFSPDGMRAVSGLNQGPPRIIQATAPSDHVIEFAEPSIKGGTVAWSAKGDRIAIADEKRMVHIYSISDTAATLQPPEAIEAFADVAPLRVAMKVPTQVNELAFNEDGDRLLVRDDNGAMPLFEIWSLSPAGATRQVRSQSEFRTWAPNRSVLLDRPIGDGPTAILRPDFAYGRALPIVDASRPQFSANPAEILFVQAKRNYQVLNIETGYPVTPPFGWWLGPITARLALYPGLIASVDNKYDLAVWDLRPEQRRWHADPPQPPPVAPVRSPDKAWTADIKVGQRVQIAPSDDETNPSVVISLDEQPSSVGWSSDGRYLRIYSKTRGYIDLEWDPPSQFEQPIHQLVKLLVTRKLNAPADRFEVRKQMSTWKAKDQRWQKLLDWWIAGRPEEPLPPNARWITDVPSDDTLALSPTGRDLPPSPWIFHDSNVRPLTEADLRDLSDDDLWNARNEIFARRGVNIKVSRYVKLVQKLGPEFHDSKLDADDAFDHMNGVETANIMLIKSIESQRLIKQ